MSADEVAALTADVPGWVTPAEGRLLYHLARRCTGRGAIVEIGSWKGKSTIWLAKGAQAGAQPPLYAIDPHAETDEHVQLGEPPTYDVFVRNLERANVRELVRPLRERAEDAAPGFTEPIELLFIDGDHRYEAVRRDWELWVPKLVDGGVVALHDVRPQLEGPRRIARERLFGGREFDDVVVVDSLAYGVKRRVGAVRYARKRAIATGRDAARRARLPEPMRAAGRRLLRYKRRV